MWRDADTIIYSVPAPPCGDVTAVISKSDNISAPGFDLRDYFGQFPVD